MSWVRYSSICDNNRAGDLYIYDSVYGVTIHVASNKHLKEENAPRIPSWKDFCLSDDVNDENAWNAWWQEYTKCKEERDKWLEENSEFVPIGLPYDGETFDIDDKEELISTLTELKSVGYNFPDSVFDLANEWEEDA